MDINDETVAECRDWIARQRAKLDQRKKQFEDQYPLMRPRLNRYRLEDLEATEFWIDIHEWELNEIIKFQEERDLDEGET